MTLRRLTPFLVTLALGLVALIVYALWPKGPRTEPGPGLPEDPGIQKPPDDPQAPWVSGQDPRTPPPPPDDQPPRTTGGLRGRFYIADDGRPVAGAEVRLRVVGAGAQGPQALARTDPQGEFRFLGLSVQRSYILELAGESHAPYHSGPLRLVAGDWLDLGEIGLTAGWRVTGRTVDVAGQPVAGAAVAAFDANEVELRPPGAAQAPPALARTQSGADGRFVFETLPDVPVILQAGAEGHAPAVSAILVSLSAPAEVELILRPGARLAGRVHNAEGQPISGAQLQLYARPAVAVGAAIRTDHAGRFALEQVPPDGLRLHVMAESYVTRWIDDPRPGEELDIALARGRTIRGRVLDAQSRAPVAGARAYAWTDTGSWDGEALSDQAGAFVLAAAPPLKLRLVVEATQGAEGFYQREIAPTGDVDLGDILLGGPGPEGGLVLAGLVRDAATGQGVGGATVELIPQADGAFLAQAADDQGRFRFAAVTNGRYRLVAQAQAQGYPPVELDLGDVSAAREDLLLELRPGASLAGRVEDAQGQPVSGATVHAELEPDPAKLGSDFSTGAYSDAQSAAEGRFQLAGLAEGAWTVFATHPRHAPSARVRITVQGAGTQELILRLGAGSVLKLRLVDAGGTPVSGAQVSLIPRGDQGGAAPPMPVQTGPDGRAQLAGLAAGPHRLYVAATHHPALERDVDINGAEVDLGDLRLEAGGRFAIRVLDGADGRPVVEAEVELSSSTDGKHGLTDAAGRVALGGLPLTGPYALRVFRDGFRPYRMDLSELPAAELELKLTRGATIQARVVSSARPAALTFILVPIADTQEELTREMVEIGPEGVVAWGGLPAGKFRLYAEIEGFALWSADAPLTLQEGQAAGPLAIAPALGARLSGRVLAGSGPDAAPAAGAWVYLVYRLGQPEGVALPSPEVQTGPDGRFELLHVAAGTHFVVATLEGHTDHHRTVTVTDGQVADDLVLELSR